MKTNVLFCGLVAGLALCASAAVESVAGFTKARPVWPEGRETEMNCHVGFRGEFDWQGGDLKLKLAGCSLFRVFVNGRFVAYGPARGPKGWFRVDEWNLGGAAKKGRNVLQIEGVAYNVGTYYVINHPGFLQAEVTSGGKVLLATGDDAVKAYGTDRIQKTVRYSFQRAFSEAYCVGPKWCAWMKGEGDALKLKEQPAVKLLPREAPYPAFEKDSTYKPVAALAVTRVENPESVKPGRYVTPENSLDGKGWFETNLAYNAYRDYSTIKAVLQEGKPKDKRLVSANRALRFKGKINDTGFIQLRAKVTKPGQLLVCFDEILKNGKLDFVNRFGCCNMVVWDVFEPGEYTFESFEAYTFKYAEVYMLGGEAEIGSLSMRTYKHPKADVGECLSQDPELNKIFEAARETFAQNAVDVFTDCPSRERAGWLCDSYFSGPAEALFTGGNQIERTFLRNFALAEDFPGLPEGMVAMCYPGDHVNKNFIPNWSMWFILQLANYAERTGDRETVDLLKGRVEGLVKFYAQYLNKDGLLEDLPAWVFVEWSHANELKLVKGVNYPSNMTYCDVLDKVAKLYGRAELAEQAAKLRETIRAKSFDGMWFRDNAAHPDVTETCQYYAFFHGVATPASHPELWKKLTTEFGPERRQKKLYPEVWPSNAFIGNLMRMEILSRQGLSAQAVREMRGYYLGMAEKTGTLWEHDSPTASCNHGFASYVAVLINRAEEAAEAAVPLKAGFARVDVTPKLGIFVAGYFVDRRAEKVLDSLEAQAVAFSDGEKTALVIGVDMIDVPDDVVAEAKAAITAATGVGPEMIFLHASHTHTGPDSCRGKSEERDPQGDDLERIKENVASVVAKLAEVSKLAIADLKPAKLSCGRGVAKRISFGRRYLMKDGKVRTNPGVNNPDIVRPVGKPADEAVQLLRIDREGGAPIAVINFQTHPDVIGGNVISADWPGLTRRTFENALADGTKCLFVNGTQGDVNHVCVDPKPGELNGMIHDFDDVWRGYDHARHMGAVVAGAALGAWYQCVPLRKGRVRGGMKAVKVPSNKPKPEEMPLAKKYYELHRAGKDAEIPFKGMELTTEVADAERKVRLEHGPDFFELPLSAVAIGRDLVFAGFPGEPFNDIGKALKKRSPFRLTIPACLTNGSRGYFPFSDAYKQGGYESRTSDFGPSVADDLIKGQLQLIESL